MFQHVRFKVRVKYGTHKHVLYDKHSWNDILENSLKTTYQLECSLSDDFRVRDLYPYRVQAVEANICNTSSCENHRTCKRRSNLLARAHRDVQSELRVRRNLFLTFEFRGIAPRPHTFGIPDPSLICAINSI